jgi:thiol:disulfide interchange protein DsbA
MFKRLAFVLLAGLAVSGVARGQALIEKYQPGVHYFPIEPAQPTTSGDKVEVVEVFSYACIHCAHFEPMVEAWKKKMPARAAFVYLPAAWNQPWEAVARAYYAAESLGVLAQTHMPLFNAIHVEHKPLGTLEDLATWYEGHGVKPADFLAAARSFAVDAKIKRSQQLVPRYGVDGTPTVIVAGKYRVTGQSAGAYEKVFEVVDFLVGKEAAALAAK